MSKTKRVRDLVWLLAITHKRRKGKPREYIAACSGGALQLLFFHQHLYQTMNVPGSWIDFKLHTLPECRKLAPYLYKGLMEERSKSRAKAKKVPA